MRFVASSPAGQLASVALRYRPRTRPGVPHWHPASMGGARAAVSQADLVGDRDRRLRRLEAVLFLAREPLTSRKLSQYANLADGTEARTLVRRLNELYDRAGRAFRVQELAGGFQMMTRPQFASWLRRLGHVPAEMRLSAPAMETLAVVAYRQPVLRADIEAIRGVNCGEILRQLMERDLVRIGGRSDELGRPYLYATTRRFLQLFGLVRIDRLPRAASIAIGEQDRSLSIHEHSNQTDENQGEELQVSVTTVMDKQPVEEAQAEEGLSQAGVLASQQGPQEATAAVEGDEDDEYEYYDDDEEEEEEEEDEDE